MKYALKIVDLARVSLVALVLIVVGCSGPNTISGYSGSSLSTTRTLYGNYLAGRFAGSVRDTKSAAVFYQRALRRDPENAPILERAFFLALADGQIDDASSMAVRIIERDPGHRTGRLVLGLDAFERGDYAGARQHLDDGRKGPISQILRDLIVAWSYAAEEEYDKAILTIDSGMKTSSFKIFYLTARANLNDFAGRNEVAKNDYTNVLQQTQWRSRRLIQAYGRLLERTGNTEDAEKIYDDYLELLPDDPFVLSDKERVQKGGKPPAIFADVKEAAADAIFGPATYLAQERNVDLPIIYLQLSLHLNPNYADARMLLGDMFEVNKGWEDALRIFSGVKSDSEYYRDAQIQMAFNLDRLEEEEAAISLLKKVVKTNPEDVYALRTLGDLYRLTDKFDEAIASYTTAIDLVPELQEEHWVLFYTRGVSYEQSDQWALAEKDFKTSLGLSPDQSLTLNYLGYSWIDRGENYDEAMDLIREAVRLNPTDGYIVDSLGWAFYKQGKYEKAVEYLERALQLQPDDPVINEHLGDAYWKVGRQIEARFQWRQSLAFDPEDDLRSIIELKLNVGLDAARDLGNT